MPNPPEIHENIPYTREDDYTKNPPISHITYGGGVKVYLQGIEHPLKGMPMESAMQAINFAKRLLMGRPFNALEWALQPHTLKSQYMCPFAREIRKMFPSKLGLIISTILEYDAAYRLRFQHLCDNTSKEKLLAHPFKEVRRLLAINKKKDLPEVHSKFKRFALCITVLLITRRQAFRDCDFSKLQTDEADRYWLKQRTDYAYQP